MVERWVMVNLLALSVMQTAYRGTRAIGSPSLLSTVSDQVGRGEMCLWPEL